jgi:GNAT superfamily N-acetyltransferase
MENINSWEQLKPIASDYMIACSQDENFVQGWRLTNGSAVLVNDGDAHRLLIGGECTPLEYVRILSEAAVAGTPAASVSIPNSLAIQIKPEKANDWYYMVRHFARPNVAMPPDCEIVSPGVIDQEIARFIQLSAPDSSAVPGHPEIDFWIIARDSTGEIAAAAAGTTWSSGAKIVASVAVGIEHRRQGWGSVVTMLALQEHFSRGATWVSLGVRGSNAGAIEMYRSLGFDIEHHLTGIRLISPDLT